MNFRCKIWLSSSLLSIICFFLILGVGSVSVFASSLKQAESQSNLPLQWVDAELGDSLQKILDSQFNMKAPMKVSGKGRAPKYKDFMGTSVAILFGKPEIFNSTITSQSSNSSILWQGVAGTKNPRSHRQKVTPETYFALGSFTKAFTAVLVLKLVEEGKLDLDGTLVEYLKVLAENPKIGGSLTLEQLLRMEGGINNVEIVDSAARTGVLNPCEWEPISALSQIRPKSEWSKLKGLKLDERIFFLLGEQLTRNGFRFEKKNKSLSKFLWKKHDPARVSAIMKGLKRLEGKRYKSLRSFKSVMQTKLSDLNLTSKEKKIVLALSNRSVLKLFKLLWKSYSNYDSFYKAISSKLKLKGRNDHYQIMTLLAPYLKHEYNARYTNANYVLAGLILERLYSDKIPIGQIFYDNLFKEHNLHEIYFGGAERPRTPHAIAYRALNPTTPCSRSTQYNQGYTAGALNATATDVAYFLDSLFRTKTILKKVDQYYPVQNNKEKQKKAYRLTRTISSQQSCYYYGMGILKMLVPKNERRMLHPSFNCKKPPQKGIPVYGHLGAINGFLTIATYYPEYEATIVMLQNNNGSIKQKNGTYEGPYLLAFNTYHKLVLAIKNHFEAQKKARAPKKVKIKKKTATPQKVKVNKIQKVDISTDILPIKTP